MGRKADTALAICFAWFALSLNCFAADASDLYAVYNKEYSVTVPEDILKTITTYENAKKYVQMYTYVVNSEYDINELQDEVKAIEERLVEVSDALLGGFKTSQAELFELENEYLELLERREDVELTLQSFPVDVVSVSASDIPKYSEYKEAIRQKNAVMANTEIGQLEELYVPVQSAAILEKHDNTSSTYKVVDGTGALSPLNGVVEKVEITDDYGLTVVIDNYNGIKTYVCNLEIVDVVEGDTVYQNQRIGYVLGTKVIFRMSLNEQFVDISKIFEEEV